MSEKEPADHVAALEGLAQEIRGVVAETRAAIATAEQLTRQLASPSDGLGRMREQIAMGESRCALLCAWQDKLAAIADLMQRQGEADTTCPDCGAPCRKEVLMRGGDNGWGDESSRTVYRYAPPRPAPQPRNDTMSRELLPCPFCGLDVTDDEGCFPVSQGYWEVRCGNPNCFAHEPASEPREAAIAKWNRRTSPEAAPKEAGDWADVNTVIQHGTCHELASQDELHRYVEARDRLLNRLATPSPQDRATGEGEIAHIAYDFLLAAGYDMDSAPLTKIKEAALSSPTGEGAMVGEEWLRQLDVLLVNAHESLPDDEIINRAIAMTHRALTASPQVQGGEAWKIGVFDRWNAYATELGFAGLVDALKWINDQRAAPQRAPGVDDTHAFKNFHRLLCERFDYAHDDIDWRRDQVSLIEHVARKVAAPVSAVGVDGVTYQSRAISDRSLKDSGWMQIPADGFMRYPTLFDYRALAAAPTPQGQGEGNA